MKFILTVGLLVSFLFSFSTMAAAEVLFGVSGEAGQADIAADYSLGILPDLSDDATQYALSANLNLLGTHFDLTYTTADMDQYALSTIDLRMGWELGLDLLKIKAFGGAQYYEFTDDTLPDHNKNTYTSLVVGIGAESKIKDITLFGSAIIPLQTKYENDDIEDDDADISFFEAGIAYAPMPFVDLFLKYRTMTADSTYLELESESYSLGLKISF